jgi:hypothetical protein
VQGQEAPAWVSLTYAGGSTMTGAPFHAFRLGHTRISATLEIHTDVDEQAERDALTQLHGLLDQGEG